MRRFSFIIALSFLSLTCFGVTGLERDILDVMQKYDAVGMSVAVVKDDSIVYSQSFGYKNKEDFVALHSDNIFRIASISKTFVGTAIMQLVEKGILSLEDDVNKFLVFKVKNPRFPETPITIKMLLCHRSSITDSQGYKSFDGINPATNSRYAECYSDNEPGSKYAYSNLNYNILGAVIENVTGKRFDKFILENIIKPLGLYGGYNVSDLDSSLFVSSYSYNKKQNSLLVSEETFLPYYKEISDYKLGYSTPFLSPAGGMKISALGLARYMKMHMDSGFYDNRWIIHQDSESLMRKVPVGSGFYALSFYYTNSIIPGEKVIGHNGGALGTHTAMFFHPKKKYGFVVLCNGYRPQSSDDVDFRTQIIRLLYNQLIKTNTLDV